ncbi:MAG: outer membrane beta-barrel protein [Bacteroidetes bacterium]|nr:outer membrane beta-barrel protein [Bacteroidota bacterium]
MQDKRIHIDEKFIDRSWVEMQLLLENEMPVQQKKRRRFIGWWWLGLIGIGVLFGAVYLFGNKKDKPETVTNQPIASSNSKVAVKPGHSEGENLSHEQLKTVGELNSPIKSSSGLMSNKGLNAGYSELKRRYTHSIKPENADNSRLNLIVESKSEGKPLLGGKESIEAVQFDGNELKTNEYNSIENLEKLAAIPINPLLNQHEFEFLLSSQNLYKRKVEWSIQASVLAVPDLSGGGFSFDLLSSNRLISNRLLLNAGLGYAFISQPIYAGITSNSIVPDAFDNNIVYGNANKDMAFEGLDPNFVTIRNQTLKLHYLTVPIQLNYQLTNRFALNVGVSTGVLLKSNSGYSKAGILNSFASSNKDASNNSTNSIISNFDFSISGGIGFKCSKSLSINLDYLHGLTDVLPNNNVGDFNRELKLGFRYKLRARH